ncbi:Solute carrier family 2, facilitated glucose transporter member 8 [Oopsacas minuta]|uniref:Solute carrier family 2, facilitated glucose transporter member 8 n=1 Tax=Oopsacas minuta TaxID=111878 RepID=A0AAV7JQ12_9METZ|nr:Solute carrier family 2, facilitated glucose transporter member 8 [Oopsacas minuta]
MATVSCLLGVFGYMLIIVTETAMCIIIGIGSVGIYSAFASIFIKIYIAEVTLDSQRKILSGGYGFWIRIGLFVAYFAGIWLPFRWLAVLGIIQICLFCFLIIINPHSPVWYVQQSLDDKAKSTLLYLHGSEFDADTEIEKIKGKTLSSKISWNESFRALKDWKVLKPIIILSLLAVLKELGGHEAMVAFSSHILENQQAMDPKVASLFYPIFLIIGAIVCILIMNYCKLKWLMITASIFQAISHISMAIYYLVSEHYLHCNTEYSQLCHTLAFWPISNLALYAFSFGFGWGLVHYSLIGIVFTKHKALSFGIVGVFGNTTSFAVIYIFFYLLQNIGGFFTFIMLSFNYLFAIGYIYLFINI